MGLLWPLALAMVILMVAPPLLFIVPGLYAMFAGKLPEKAFHKYLQQVQKPTETETMPPPTKSEAAYYQSNRSSCGTRLADAVTRRSSSPRGRLGW